MRKHRIILLLSLFLILFALSAGAGQTCKETILSSTPKSIFILNANGTVLQNTTGLMWMRCSLGQQWDGKSCTGNASSFTWQEGLNAAANQSFAGYNNWRLPNKNELESLVDDRCATPAINTEVFPMTPSSYFWAASPYAGVSYAAWSVDFGYGVVTATLKTGKILVRPVRDSE